MLVFEKKSKFGFGEYMMTFKNVLKITALPYFLGSERKEIWLCKVVSISPRTLLSGVQKCNNKGEYIIKLITGT